MSSISLVTKLLSLFCGVICALTLLFTTIPTIPTDTEFNTGLTLESLPIAFNRYNDSTPVNGTKKCFCNSQSCKLNGDFCMSNIGCYSSFAIEKRTTDNDTRKEIGAAGCLEQLSPEIKFCIEMRMPNVTKDGVSFWTAEPRWKLRALLICCQENKCDDKVHPWTVAYTASPSDLTASSAANSTRHSSPHQNQTTSDKQPSAETGNTWLWNEFGIELILPTYAIMIAMYMAILGFALFAWVIFSSCRTLKKHVCTRNQDPAVIGFDNKLAYNRIVTHM